MDLKTEIEEIRNNLLAILARLENDEVSTKEANDVRRENNKRLKKLLKGIRKQRLVGTDNGEKTS